MPKKDRVIPAAQFKATCLAVLDEVDEEGITVIVTKRGRPVARIVRIVEDAPKASLIGSVVRQADLVSPIGEVWDADV